MRRWLTGLGWLLAFGAAGAALLPLLSLALAHKPAPTRQMLSAGAEIGLDAYLFLLFFGVLPGTFRAGPALPLGPWQAVWALLGFMAMLAAGGLGSYNILILANLGLDAAHAGWHADLSGRDALLAAACGGEAAAALWISWVLHRAGPAQLANGAATGIAWRAASSRAYGAAWLCAVAIIAIVIGLFHIVPPDLRALEDLPSAQLFKGGGWELLPLLALVMLVGPVVEELVFRGVAFAGFARRFGPVWAAAITTLIFIAVHAPEKLHYPPGFLDVGLMAVAACWLRVKFASIRPGILLHVLYNAGLILAGGLMH